MEAVVTSGQQRALEALDGDAVAARRANLDAGHVQIINDLVY